MKQWGQTSFLWPLAVLGFLGFIVGRGDGAVVVTKFKTTSVAPSQFTADSASPFATEVGTVPVQE